jgi:hypothetical protein
LNTLAASIQKLSSKPLEITHVPCSIFEDKLKVDPNDIGATLWLGWDSGKGLHPNSPSHNVLPGWEPKKALDVLKSLML